MTNQTEALAEALEVLEQATSFTTKKARDGHAKAVAGLRAAISSQPPAPREPTWLPIKQAPRDGTNLLLRFGIDGVSQGKYVPGLPHPWKFIDTNDGITWLVNHSVDGPGGPSHYMAMPSASLTGPASCLPTATSGYARDLSVNPLEPRLDWSGVDVPESGDDLVMVPRCLIGAACAAITKKHDAPKTLEQLRRYTVGDLSHPS